MNLIIVESPTKAKTLSRFLGKDYVITASMGHVRDLPKSKFGVDIEHNFEPQYETSKGKEETISRIKSEAKRAGKVILATDPDREGEAISAHIKDLLLEDKKLKLSEDKFSRITFHEITKEAIEEALTHPGQINTQLVDAQTARRVLDRIVGYRLSPLLWQKIRRGLSAGRVQSVAVRLIVEREREIEKFGLEKYWTITAALLQRERGKGKGESVDFELIEINGEKIEIKKKLELYDGEYTYAKTTLDTQIKADEIVASLQDSPFTVSNILQKETKRSPYAPFTTSTLQQEASRRFGFSAKRTMTIAQQLYEEGHITYHRTDSVAMAKQAVAAFREFVEKEYGSKYLYSSVRMYSSKQKLAQEAHEAIRPTKVQVKKDAIDMGNDHKKLYDLIWKRAVATQMADAILESTTVFADAKEYRFKANGSVIVFDGFLKLYGDALTEQRLPVYTQGEVLTPQALTPIEHETTPPPRYNEASLIKALEEKGIGRPSTYAPIISTIQDRQYVEREQGRFIPTAIGNAVNDFLVENFDQVVDIPFTAQMEDEFDQIAQGELKWQPAIAEFYKPFEAKVEGAKETKRVKIETEETGEMCPNCGKPVVIRTGRFGKFLSCSNFPECKYTKSLQEELDIPCPVDGGKIVSKKTRFGRTFYGCANYPKCTYAAWKKEDVGKPQKTYNPKGKGKSKNAHANSATKRTKVTRKTTAKKAKA